MEPAANPEGVLAPIAGALRAALLQPFLRLEFVTLWVPICCDPDREGRVVSWAALVSRISAWRVCSFQPPPPRLAKSLPTLTGPLGPSGTGHSSLLVEGL